MRNPEYLAVLSEAVEAVRNAMADRRLPDLTPEQLAWWFKSVSTSDVERVTEQHRERRLEIVWRQDRPRDSQDERAA